MRSHKHNQRKNKKGKGGGGSAKHSHQNLLQDLDQSLAIPHTVGKLAAEYRDEHTKTLLQSCKLWGEISSDSLFATALL